MSGGSSPLDSPMVETVVHRSSPPTGVQYEIRSDTLQETFTISEILAEVGPAPESRVLTNGESAMVVPVPPTTRVVDLDPSLLNTNLQVNRRFPENHPSGYGTPGHPQGFEIEGNFKPLNADVRAGKLICLDAECEVLHGRFGAGWYLVLEGDAADSDIIYERHRGKYVVKVEEEEEEEEFRPYAEYGYWMTPQGEARTFSRHILADPSAPEAPANLADLETPGEAVYRGRAAGVLLDQAGGAYAGDFVADISLTAVFGREPRVGGLISNFEADEPDPARPIWTSTIALPISPIDKDTKTFSGRTFLAGIPALSWSGTFYGDGAAARPLGVHGGFEIAIRGARNRAVGAFSAR